tara:strand:+ start:743 stop:2008 length:1266 start_codon:yes stop_codon:yes gene_type:complete
MSIDQMIDRKADIYSAMQPQQIQRQAKISGGLLDALAAQKALSDKQAAKNQLAMAMQDDAKTVAQQNEEALTQRSQMEIAQGLGGILKNRQNRQNQNAKLIRNMNPAMLKAMGRRPVQRAAQGGIVGFSNGGSTNEDTTIPDSLKKIYKYIMDLNKQQSGGIFSNLIPPITSDTLPFMLPPMFKYGLGQGYGPEIPTLEGDVEEVVPSSKIGGQGPFPNPPVEAPVETPVDEATGIGLGRPTAELTDAEKRRRLLAFLSAPMTGRGLMGAGSPTRAVLNFDERRDAEDLVQFKAETDRQTAEASKELNRIRNDQLNFSALQTRYAALAKIYDEIAAEETEKFQADITGLRNESERNPRMKESNDKKIRAIELEIASNIAKRAGQESDMLGEYNIIAEIKALGERLRNYNFDASRGVRKVSD